MAETRYLVQMEFYVYEQDAEAANKKAKKIAAKMEKKRDNDAAVTGIFKQDFARAAEPENLLSV